MEILISATVRYAQASRHDKDSPAIAASAEIFNQSGSVHFWHVIVGQDGGEVSGVSLKLHQRLNSMRGCHDFKIMRGKAHGQSLQQHGIVVHEQDSTVGMHDQDYVSSAFDVNEGAILFLSRA